MGVRKPADDLLIAATVANPLPVIDCEHEIVANEYGFCCIPDAFKGREMPDILGNGGFMNPQP